MSAIRDGRYPIVLDKERHLLISLNVLDAIQDRFGTYEDLPQHLQGKDAIKNLRWVLALTINEGKNEDEPDVTEIEVGRMIHTGNMREAVQAVYKAFGLAVAGDAKEDEQADDDVESEDDFQEADKERS